MLIRLAGERLILKEIEETDLDFLCKLAQEPEVYYFDDEEQTSEVIIRHEYRGMIAKATTAPKQGIGFLVCLAETLKPIGGVDIKLNWEKTREWEFGYQLHPSFWGKGYASEAVNLVIDYAFEHLNVHKLVAFCNAENTRSIALLERLGLTKEAHGRESRWLHHRWYDECMYTMLDREWQAARKDTDKKSE